MRVYQIPMDYWADVMQDYAYVIVQDGWRRRANPRAWPVKGKYGKNIWKEIARFRV